jgi:protein TonB
MVIIWRSNKKWIDDNLDQKQYFIRKEKFNKLTLTEKEILKAPTANDSAYLKEIIIRKQKRNSVSQDFLLFSEVSPSYPSGDEAMKAFLKKTLQRPKSLAKSGQVHLSFIVETNGELTNIQVEKSLTNECDNEAIRVVKLMPRWTPGTQNGQKVRVKKFITIPF